MNKKQKVKLIEYIIFEAIKKMKSFPGRSSYEIDLSGFMITENDDGFNLEILQPRGTAFITQEEFFPRKFICLFHPEYEGIRRNHAKNGQTAPAILPKYISPIYNTEPIIPYLKIYKTFIDERTLPK